MYKHRDNQGMALTVVLIITTCLLFVAAASLKMGADFNTKQKKFNVESVKSYYLAKSGIVDAEYRITNNLTADIDGGSGDNFSNPLFDPPPYLLDFDVSPLAPQPAPDPSAEPSFPPGPNTVIVDISTDTGSGRQITAKGYSS